MPQRNIQELIASYPVELPSYIELYKHFHLHPELSNQEKETAETCATYLARLGDFEIHTHIGGYGLAGVLRNGPGQTILIRGEMDALPVLEQTGLSYASTITTVDSSGIKQPVMHACGHDSPSASMLLPSYSVLDIHTNSLISAHDMFTSCCRSSGWHQRIMEWNFDYTLSAS